MACLPFLAADMLTITSGSEVPNAIPVRAISSGEMPAISEITSNATIVYFAPRKIKTPPRSKIRYAVGLTEGLSALSTLSPLNEFIKNMGIQQRKRIASNKVKLPSLSAKYMNIAEHISKGISMSITSKSNLICFPTIAVNPSTKRIFVILEPMTFPTTISEDPENTEAMEVANSGKEVPKATIVTPIINGDIPKDRPTFSAASINLSEAYNRTTKLTINRPI